MALETNDLVNLGRIKSTLPVPDLIDTQFRSYAWFLQADIDPNKRKSQGLQAVFEDSFPIESPNDDMVLEFVSYEFGESRWGVLEAKDRNVTYARPLKAMIRLINKGTGEVREQSVYMGDIPMMTSNGTVIVNGAERVVVSQLHRSPGIFFFYDVKTRVYSLRIIPYRGSWLELEIDNKGILMASIDRKKKFPATLLLKAMGKSSNEEILHLFYEKEAVSLNSLSAKELKKLIGRRSARVVLNPDSNDELIYAGEKLNEDTINLIRELNIAKLELIVFPMGKDDVTIINCLEKDGVKDQDAALIKIYQVLRPGDLPNIDNVKAEFKRLFFSSKSYDLGSVGRYKINNKFRYHDPKNFNSKDRVLREIDLVTALRYLVNLVNEVPEFNFDDIDHLGNRRVRSIGELLMNQVKLGFSRIERVVKERMAIQDIDVIAPQALISIKPIVALINEFFGSSQLSQFMDQTNPLSELTHKRRLNALGPGGLSRERAGFEVRDVHYSHYGRMCPIETPEGPNIGLISSMSSYSFINDYGFLASPYFKVKDGKVLPEVEYLTADVEEHFNVAQANSVLEEDGRFKHNSISCRKRADFPFCVPEEVQYMDVSPMQIVSVSTALIPFLEHDDANRALMGSNMQRQAVPLLTSQRPYVGTGMEFRVAYDSRYCVLAEEDGVVVNISSSEIHVVSAKTKEMKIYPLIKFRRSNQNTCLNQTPIVLLERAPSDAKISKVTSEFIEMKLADGKDHKIPLKVNSETELVSCVKTGANVEAGAVVAGQKVFAVSHDRWGRMKSTATVLADGQAIDNKRLALGKNILVAFMSWGGYNFEDAILISERVIKDDVFTSLHIEEYEIRARETKLGQEIITRDIPHLSDKAFRDLDENGVIRNGANVKSGDILVGMVTPRGDTDLTPEYKLLHSIFGDKAREVRDCSLRTPNGVEGVVIGSLSYSRSDGDELPVGVETMIKVFVAKKSKLQVGDKMAGRHGNKGVIARILPEEDMPYLEDGTPIDIVLNPLGVPSRMNIGQILETQLGFAAEKLGLHFEVPVFGGAQESDIQSYMNKAGLPEDCKFDICDGRTGDKLENRVFCGYIYMLKLGHLVDDKIHARSTGPYSLVTQQPLGGKAQFGGQRLGEMEVWALEAYGAAHTLQELLTVKSDDMIGRARIYEAIVKGVPTINTGTPESFNVLMQELRGLALDMSLYSTDNERMEVSDLEDGLNRMRRPNKIKLDSIEKIN